MKFSDLPPPTKEAKTLARTLRKNMTPAEGLIWQFLRKRYMNTRFRRQHPIGKYIVDFIALEIGLVVELDGGHHFSSKQMVHDKKRTEYLEKFDLKVVRYTNDEISNRTEAVIEHLSTVIKSMKTTLSK